MDMIAVCDVVSVCYTLDNTETLLQTSCKFVCCGLQWRAVKAEIYVCFCSPLCAGVIKVLHNFKCKRSCWRVCVWLARHVSYAFAKTCIAKWYGGISAEQELVDSFALFKPCQCTVLPKNRRNVWRSAFKSFVTEHQRTSAKLKSFIKYLPELIHILIWRAGNVHKVYCNNALIESAVIFRLAVFVKICCKEASAAHARVALTIAILVYFKLLHFLFAYIVRNHSLCGTLCSKLCKLPIFWAFSYVVLFKDIY